MGEGALAEVKGGYMSGDQRIVQVLKAQAARLRTSVELIEGGKKTVSENGKDVTKQSLLADKNTLMEFEALIDKIESRNRP